MGLFQDVLESADGGVFTNLRDAAGTGLTSTLVSAKQALDVNIANSISVGVADKTTYTYGTTVFLPVGGVYQDTSPSLTAGQSGAFRLTANRAVQVNLRDAAGNELGATNAAGVFVRPGDGTNLASFSATGEEFVQIRQGANAATVTAANELKVLDSSSAALLAFLKSATGTITTPTLTSSSSTLLASNASRKGFSFFNSSIYPMYVAHAATATTSSFTERVNANSMYEQMDAKIYTGIVTMITPTVIGTPTIPVTEYT